MADGVFVITMKRAVSAQTAVDRMPLIAQAIRFAPTPAIAESLRTSNPNLQAILDGWMAEWSAWAAQ